MVAEHGGWERVNGFVWWCWKASVKGEGEFLAKHEADLLGDQFSEQIKHRSGGGAWGRGSWE